jgi:hypothetical protein
MSDNKAFVYQIALSGSGPEENALTHQTSPCWVLTVVRWKNRDTLRTTGADILATLDPLIIASDCVQVTTDGDKGTLTPSFTALLKVTDTNYLTAIGPGDFLFVNMLNWEEDANRIIKQIQNGQAINGFFDGFKGFFKVQGVREVISVDPQSGVKIVLCKLNGFGFTEFNNTIYYNPNVLDQDKGQQQLVFTSQFGDVFNNLIKAQIDGIGKIIQALIETFIGTGASGGGIVDIVNPSKNIQFLMPQSVGTLLGITNVTAAKDVYNYIFGIQNYSGSSVSDPGTGFNPVGLSNNGGVGFKLTQTPCQGNGFLKPEYWNQVKAWSILNQYTNAPLNELYTCFRVDTDGSVMPTVVFRQTPFTTETFQTSSSITRFMTLPRWYVPPTLITNLDIGRDEAARVNFVQCYAQSSFDKGGTSVSFETAAGNFLYDSQDVMRSGLRPYIFNSTFDEIPQDATRQFYRSPLWAKVVGDCVMGQHLKLNGTITCIGIVEPISVGDNLELNDVVYHIEQVSHSCSISGDNGMKTFRTIISLTNGVSVASSGLSAVSSVSVANNSQGDLYAEMKNSNAQNEREDDYNFNKLLPGISEAQAIPSRTNIDIPASADNYSFPEPNTPVIGNKKITKTPGN